jgi:hypothetical protein
MSHPNMLRFICFQTARVAYSVHDWWLFLMLLDLFRWDFFNNTGNVVTRVLVYFQDFMIFFIFFPLFTNYKEKREKKKKKKPEEYYVPLSMKNTLYVLKHWNMRLFARHVFFYINVTLKCSETCIILCKSYHLLLQRC